LAGVGFAGGGEEEGEEIEEEMESTVARQAWLTVFQL